VRIYLHTVNFAFSFRLGAANEQVASALTHANMQNCSKPLSVRAHQCFTTSEVGGVSDRVIKQTTSAKLGRLNLQFYSRLCSEITERRLEHHATGQ
jgi:hypothetical protein